MRSERQSETSRTNGAKSHGPKTPKGRATRAVDDRRRLRGGNILNENKILQNEPETPDLSPLDTTKADSEISTEPEEPKP